MIIRQHNGADEIDVNGSEISYYLQVVEKGITFEHQRTITIGNGDDAQTKVTEDFNALNA